MISKTIGFRGTNHFQTNPYMFRVSNCSIFFWGCCSAGLPGCRRVPSFGRMVQRRLACNGFFLVFLGGKPPESCESSEFSRNTTITIFLFRGYPPIFWHNQMGVKPYEQPENMSWHLPWMEKCRCDFHLPKFRWIFNPRIPCLHDQPD